MLDDLRTSRRVRIFSAIVGCWLMTFGVTTPAALQKGLMPEPQGKPTSPPAQQAPTTPSSTPLQTPPSQVTQSPTAAAQSQLSTPVVQQPATPLGQVRIGDTGNVVRLNGTSGQVVLTITGLGAAVDALTGADLAALAATLQVAETVRLGEPAVQARVAIAVQAFLGRSGAGSLSWLVLVTANSLPANTVEKRVTTLAIGAANKRDLYPLEFTLTNQPPSTAQYEVIPPGHDWMVSRSDADEDRTYPLTIVNRSEAISNLRLAQVSLKRADDGGSIGYQEVKLLPAADAAQTAIDLQPNEAKTVFLRLDRSDRLLPYGTFAGQVQLVSSGTVPRAVPLTARVTSAGVRRFGALLVLIGLLTSLFVTTRLRPRIARLRALRPATVLRDLVVSFATESAKQAGDDLAGIIAEATRQANRIDIPALDAAGLLPLDVSVAGGLAGNAATELQARLNDVSGRLAGLIVLRDTVVQLARKNPRAGRSANVQKAIDDLNDAAPRATTASVAQAAVTPILATMQAAAAPGREDLLRVSQADVTTQQLDFLLHQTANVAALIWAVVSLAIGVTYVYSDVDFGTPLDLLGMFLWGLGLTTFGAGIQQLTPGQVGTQIGVALPRSGTTDAA